MNFCGNYDESWADSPDDYRYIADSVGKVGEVLEVDVSKFCNGLESRASEWEEELRSSQEDREEDDGDDEERWSRSDMTPDDSSVMFEELLDELNESNT